MIVLCPDFLSNKSLWRWLSASFSARFYLRGRGDAAPGSSSDLFLVGPQFSWIESWCSLPHAATAWTCSCQAEKRERDPMQVLTGDCISGLLFERCWCAKSGNAKTALGNRGQVVDLDHNDRVTNALTWSTLIKDRDDAKDLLAQRIDQDKQVKQVKIQVSRHRGKYLAHELGLRLVRCACRRTEVQTHLQSIPLYVLYRGSPALICRRVCRYLISSVASSGLASGTFILQSCGAACCCHRTCAEDCVRYGCMAVVFLCLRDGSDRSQSCLLAPTYSS